MVFLTSLGVKGVVPKKKMKDGFSSLSNDHQRICEKRTRENISKYEEGKNIPDSVEAETLTTCISQCFLPLFLPFRSVVSFFGSFPPPTYLLLPRLIISTS